MYTCPCCGFKTFQEDPIGTFDICDVCGWEVDTVQSTDPDYEGGPNGCSLREYQYEFYKELENEGEVPNYEKDNDWKRLSPPIYKPNHIKTAFYVDKKGYVKKAD